MIDFLVGLHPGKEFRLDVVVGPADIKIKIGDGLGLHKPFIFFSDVLDNGILCFCMEGYVPLTLIAILFFLLLNWFL